MMDASRHPRITLHMQSEVTGLDGRPGRFRARLRTAPRYVDPELCVGCGLCAEACPQIRPNPYDVGLKAAKAIDRPFPQAVPAAFHIDREACLNGKILVCPHCMDACEVDAIDFDMPPEELEVHAGVGHGRLEGRLGEPFREP